MHFRTARAIASGIRAAAGPAPRTLSVATAPGEPAADKRQPVATHQVTDLKRPAPTQTPTQRQVA